MTRYTVLVASLQPRSELRTAAIHAADALAVHAGLSGSGHVIDLAELGSDLLSEGSSRAVRAAESAVRHSEVVLVASPQIHGTYAGLLKVFLDRLPQVGLAHAVAVPVAAVDDLRNGHGVEEDLRLVFSDLGAWVAEPGLLLSSSELARPLGVIEAWAEVAAPALREALAVRV